MAAVGAESATSRASPFSAWEMPASAQRLAFDGGPGHYQAITGQVSGGVKYDNPVGPLSFNTTSLILLTLDVRSNLPNSPTFVDLDFGSEDAFTVSTFVDFICWGEFQLSVDIDRNLTQQQMGSRKGVVQSGQAEKVPFAGISDTAGPVTLLGLVQTDEGPAAGSLARSYIFSMYNDSVPIPTSFVQF